MTTPKYPDVHVTLVGEDGNAFAIMARTRRALQKAKVPQEVIAEYTKEAMASDYDHLLATTMNWVDVD